MSEQIKDGGPAVPVHFATLSVSPSAGMTLRDYFAAKAMQVLVAEYWAGVHANRHGAHEGWKDGLSFDAYQMADAMLAAREVKA